MVKSSIRLAWVWVLVKTVGCIKIVPDGYQRHLPPRSPGDGPVDVSLSMKVNGIYEVNLEDMSLLFELYFRVSWRDPRLTFPGNEDNNTASEAPAPTSSSLSSSSSSLSSTSVSSTSSSSPSSSSYPYSSSSAQEKSFATSSDFIRMVWSPDVFIRGTRAIDTFTIFQKFQGVIIYPDSTVFISTMMQLKLGCTMTFHKYPFDVQHCVMHISSYMYNRHEITLSWMKLGLSADSDIINQLASYDYDLIRFNKTLCRCSNCIPEYSPCIRVMLILRRHSFIHVMGEFVPSSLFVLVGWASFFWPAEVVPGRTVLVITALLTVTSMYSDIRQTSPTTSYVKAIDVWLFMCILMTTVPLFQYAVVLTWRRKQGLLNVRRVTPLNKTPNEGSKIHDTYVLYEKRTEWAGRVGVPLCFVIFNLVYWPTYLRS